MRTFVFFGGFFNYSIVYIGNVLKIVYFKAQMLAHKFDQSIKKNISASMANMAVIVNSRTADKHIKPAGWRVFKFLFFTS